MSNSIVFQHNPEKLLTGVYGYVGSINSYVPLKLTASGSMYAVLSTINAIATTVNVRIADRVGTVIMSSMVAAANSTVTTSLYNIGNYQDVSFYVLKSSNNAVNVQVNVMAGPTNATSTFPLVSINEQATLPGTLPKLITYDYYAKYNALQFVNTSSTAATIQYALIARY